MARLLKLAVYPCRYAKASPIPNGWLPRLGKRKAFEMLYPDEELALMHGRNANGRVVVPFLRRLFYGFLCREGMRKEEAAALQWRDIDLERGKVYLDENKTDEARDWDLDPGVLQSLQIWYVAQPDEPLPTDRVFADSGVPLSMDHLADHLREDLKAVGVKREQLFERSANRQPIRVHDLRATFITIALAGGKGETWIADRTGHKSSAQIAAYRRRARTWTGMRLSVLENLSSSVPELASLPRHCPGDTLRRWRNWQTHWIQVADRRTEDGAGTAKTATNRPTAKGYGEPPTTTPGQSPGQSDDVHARLIEQHTRARLINDITRAALDGDVEALRVAQERLSAHVERPSPAPVIDIASRRRRG